MPSRQEVALLYDIMDKNHDGKLDFAEFEALAMVMFEGARASPVRASPVRASPVMTCCSCSPLLPFLFCRRCCTAHNSNSG